MLKSPAVLNSRDTEPPDGAFCYYVLFDMFWYAVLYCTVLDLLCYCYHIVFLVKNFELHT